MLRSVKREAFMIESVILVSRVWDAVVRLVEQNLGYVAE